MSETDNTISQVEVSNEMGRLNLVTNEDEQSEKNDVITLKGCGVITRWTFPENQTRCPISGCWKLFDNRSIAIEHYKRSHSKKTILCFACNAPMCVYNDDDFENHYRRMHPDVEMPFQFNQKIKEELPSENDQKMNDIDIGNDDEDDMITLYGCSQTTYWRFPENMTLCPVSSCNETFEVRSEAIKHFRESHAQHSIHCSICEKVITTYSFEGYMAHFYNFHPDEIAPLNLNEQSRNTDSNEQIEEAGPLENGVISDDHNEQQQQRRRIDDDYDSNSLEGSGQIIQWQFPLNQTDCPVKSCQKTCDNHLNAVEDSNLQHSEIERDRNVFLSHNIELNPHEETPRDSGQSNTFASKEEEEKESKTCDVENKNDDDNCDDDSNHEEDDLITLEGCGITTKWKFSENTTICPLKACHYQTNSRSDVIIHYKRHHAKNAILCSLCNKPISVQNNEFNFVTHYRRCHPSRKIPYKFYRKRTNQENQKPIEKENDLITLRGCEQITKWRFPSNLTVCPINTCREAFKSRLNAIKHFKLEHADHAILCSPCNKPIRARQPRFFIEHYRQMHPHKEIPFDFGNKNISKPMVEVNSEVMDEDGLIELSGGGVKTKWKFPLDSTTCPVRRCEETFATRSHAIDHYKQQHAQLAIYCSLCDKPIVTGVTLDAFKIHYQRLHPYQKIPFNLDDDDENLSNTEQAVDEEREEEEEVDDLIILEGLRQITEWRFPKSVTRCPFMKCKKAFKLRSTAIAHYKQKHAPECFLCPDCNYPIRVPVSNPFAIMYHYRDRHKNVDIPINIRRGMRQSIHDRNFESDNRTLETDIYDDEEDVVIKLTGCGQQTEWLFPQNITHCPAPNCNKEFGIRAYAIAHYKRLHAKTSVYCLHCDRPIRAKNIASYVNHYNKYHPNEEKPVHLKQSKPDEDMSTTNDDDGDLITLEGCGILTIWKFPVDLTKCPVNNCEANFDSRSDAIIHYKRNHAKSAILCSLCNKPISVHNSEFNFVTHYHRCHPHQKIPFDLDEDEMNQNEGVDNKYGEEVNDIIKLKGLGSVTYWRFPQNITRCPYKKCKKAFKTRLALVNHYTRKHAPNCVLCPVCDTPVSAVYQSYVISHYRRHHPTVEIPSKFNINASKSLTDASQTDQDLIALKGCDQITYWRFPPNETHCPVRSCRKDFGFRSNAIEHYKKRHANRSFYCSVCEKPLCGMNIYTLKQHYRNTHPKEELPAFLKTDENEMSESDSHVDNSDDLDAYETSDDVETDTGADDLITLTGCGTVTQWKFPENITDCPVHMCNATFSTRSDAIQHYKFRHAMNSTYCSLCDKPIVSYHGSNFKSHYLRMHPNANISIHFNNDDDDDDVDDDEMSVSEQSHGNRTLRSKYKVDEREDVDCEITLEGCGQISQWKFPKDLKKCPIAACGIQFDTRSNAFYHFKDRHAMYSIYCSICRIPFIAHRQEQIQEHNKRMHSKAASESPRTSRSSTQSSRTENVEQENSENHNDTENNDLIELHGCGLITHWRWPNGLTQCPVLRCNKQFLNRSNAIEHYKKHHAMNAIYCSICDKPKIAYRMHEFQKHCDVHRSNTNPTASKNHSSVLQNVNSTEPNVNETENDVITLSGCKRITKWRFPAKMKHCPVTKCHKSFQSRQSAIAHYTKIHAPNSFYCSICEKPLALQNVTNLLLHFRNRHPGKKIPPKENQTRYKQAIQTKGIKRVATIQKSNPNVNQDNDFIILNAFGKIAKWRFPDTLDCPSKRCHKKFSNRPAAISHYQTNHVAKNAILCTICKKPVNVRFLGDINSHYRKHKQILNVGHHINAPFRKHIELKRLGRPSKHNPERLVTLTGWGMRSIWLYRSVKSNGCPVVGCFVKSKSQAAAIDHYKEKHAMNSVLCHICNKPVSVECRDNYKIHFQRLHPHMKIPQTHLKMMTKKVHYLKRVNDQKRCKVNESSFKSGPHQKKEKSSKMLRFCPLVKCPFKAQRIEQIRAHWKTKHGNLRFPEIRSEFSSKASDSSNDSDEFNKSDENISTSGDSDDSVDERQTRRNTKRKVYIDESEDDSNDESLVKPTKQHFSSKSSSDDDSSICLKQLRTSILSKKNKRKLVRSTNISSDDNQSEDPSIIYSAKRRKTARNSSAKHQSDGTDSSGSEKNTIQRQIMSLPECRVELDKLEVAKYLAKKSENLRKVSTEELINEFERSSPSSSHSIGDAIAISDDSDDELKAEEPIKIINVSTEQFKLDVQYSMELGPEQSVTDQNASITLDLLEPVQEQHFEEISYETFAADTYQYQNEYQHQIDQTNSTFSSNIIDIETCSNVKTEPTGEHSFQCDDTIYISDSDEEIETNQNCTWNNATNDLNTSHVRTYGVLMMAVPKLEPQKQSYIFD